jgi:hypothetical protein
MPISSILISSEYLHLNKISPSRFKISNIADIIIQIASLKFNPHPENKKVIFQQINEDS